MRYRTPLACTLLLGFALVGCQDDAADTTAPLAPETLHAPAPDDGQVTDLVDLPPHPESAVHDAVSDAYLVSNLGVNTRPEEEIDDAPFAHLFDTDDNGFISRVELNPDGTVAGVAEHWIAHPDVADGETEATADVDGITGVTIHDGELYAVDRDEILVFDLDDPATWRRIPLPGDDVAASSNLSLPNDVVVGANGRVWLTDTGLNSAAGRTHTDAVYSWDGSSWTKVAGGPAGESDLGCPNGIDLTGASGHPLLLTFCSNEVKRITPGRVTTHATVEDPASGVGRLDGLVRQTDGTLIFSDWRVPQHGLAAGGGVLRWVHPNGRTDRVILDDLFFPADIGFDAARDRVLIPSDGDQALKIVTLGGS